jgi:spore coat protein U-like protein
MRFQKRIVGLLLALVSSFPAGPAAAAIATTTFQVTTNVNAACTIAAANLAFADYTNTQLDGQSEITLTCTNSAIWNIGLDAGTSTAATVTTRAMTGTGSAKINYELFSDPTRTTNWGNTVGTDTVSGVGTGAVEIVNVYGRIPAAQNPAVGGYADTITATITF